MINVIVQEVHRDRSFFFFQGRLPESDVEVLPNMMNWDLAKRLECINGRDTREKEVLRKFYKYVRDPTNGKWVEDGYLFEPVLTLQGTFKYMPRHIVIFGGWF